MKSDKETREEGKKRGASMERSKAGMNKNKSQRSSLPNHHIIIIIIIIIYHDFLPTPRRGCHVKSDKAHTP